MEQIKRCGERDRKSTTFSTGSVRQAVVMATTRRLKIAARKREDHEMAMANRRRQGLHFSSSSTAISSFPGHLALSPKFARFLPSSAPPPLTFAGDQSSPSPAAAPAHHHWPRHDRQANSAAASLGLRIAGAGGEDRRRRLDRSSRLVANPATDGLFNLSRPSERVPLLAI